MFNTNAYHLFLHLHAFYPRRCRQRCTLRHVMPRYKVHTLLTIYVVRCAMLRYCECIWLIPIIFIGTHSLAMEEMDSAKLIFLDGKMRIMDVCYAWLIGGKSSNEISRPGRGVRKESVRLLLNKNYPVPTPAC
ncbi:hypothetical protein SFRURICE_017430 [Spodoptera frugiperda]|nr:hypothetical protein SFRURICE_017430 [Spodoptera frugiperda]